MVMLHALRNEVMPHPDVLNAWFMTMQGRGWTKEFAAERVRAAGDTKQFGNLRFDSFIESRCFYSKHEVTGMAIEIIEARAREMRELKIDEREIEAQGLADIRGVYNRRLLEAVEARKAAIAERAKEVSNYLRTCNAAEADAIRKVLIAQGKLDEKDEYWRSYLHLFAPHVMDEVERMMQRKDR